MKVFRHIEEVDIASPSLTIGNFDGVHLGHQKILEQASILLTFSNHPAEVLTKRPLVRLTSLSHRLNLIRQMKLDGLILLPFTEQFSRQTPEEFLTHLKTHLPFSHLILGHDAVIGHQREGNEQVVKQIGKKLGFTVNYIDPISVDGVVISSSQIRKRIQTGDLEGASRFLGRPYSIRGAVERGASVGKRIGVQTANISVEHLCLPPLGVYAAYAGIGEQQFPAVINLGYAPTLHAERPPLLEVHILDYDASLYDQEIEVYFVKYLRPEKRFASIEELKAQIQVDIAQSRALLTSSLLAPKETARELNDRPNSCSEGEDDPQPQENWNDRNRSRSKKSQ